MSRITEANFLDLFLGDGFSSVKQYEGAEAPLINAPAEWADDLVKLRNRCVEYFAQGQDPEFSLIEDGIVLRVTQIPDAFGQDVYVLRKSNAKIRPFDSLGFTTELSETLLSSSVRGLVIFCGEMGTGKTSTAASLVVARLIACGGIALAVEDPHETNLNGPHGEGRCIQMQVSRRTGGYEEALLRALRTGADLIFIGEIRDGPTAAQAVRASINGHFIVATSHSGSVSQSIERIASLAQPEVKNAHEILAQGLLAVVCLSFDSQGVHKTLKVKSLVMTGKDGPAIREKIRVGRTPQVDQDVENQSQRSLWG